jgi:hypothetical protein
MLEEKYKNLFLNLVTYVWAHEITVPDIESWCRNFDGRCFGEGGIRDERSTALALLTHVVYLNDPEIRYLITYIYQLFRRSRVNKILDDGVGLNEAYQKVDEDVYNRKYRFMGFTGTSKSGEHIAYLLRTRNSGLTLDHFEVPKKPWGNINAVAFIDDFLGTGDTFTDFVNNGGFSDLIENDVGIDCYFLFLAGLRRGIKVAERYGEVICPIIFEDDDKPFADDSVIFPDPADRYRAERLCAFYGSLLIGTENQFGYGSSQGLLAMAHNTPDNTLPIFWARNAGWRPLFKRFGD